MTGTATTEKPPKPPWRIRLTSWKWWVYGDAYSQSLEIIFFKSMKLGLKHSTPILFFILLTSIQAEVFAQTRQSIKDACFSLTTSDSSYQNALYRLQVNPSFVKWESLQKKQGNSVATIDFNNMPKYFKGKCYWSISVYKSSSKDLQFWKSFLFEVRKIKENK